MSNQAGQYFADHASSNSEHDRLGRICKQYDHWTKEQILKTGLKNGMSVAEIGFGTGSMLKWLAKQVGESGVAHGYDLTSRFLAKGIADNKNVTLFESNIQDSPLPENQYDLIYTRLLLAHLFDPLAAIINIKSGLKSGGKFVALDYDSSIVSADSSAHEDHPKLAKSFDGAVRRVNEGIGEQGLISATYGAEMKGQFKQLAFADVKETVLERRHIGGDFGALLSAEGIELLGQARPEISAYTETIVKAMRTPGFKYRDTDMYCCVGTKC